MKKILLIGLVCVLVSLKVNAQVIITPAPSISLVPILTGTTGDIVYFSATNTLNKLPDVAAGSVLVSGGVGVAPAYSASPTLTTSLTVPSVIGGIGTTSTLVLQPTSGVGTTGADIVLKYGNNGASEGLRLFNSGQVSINGATAISSVNLYVAGNTIIGPTGANGHTTLESSNGSRYTIASVNNGNPNLGFGFRYVSATQFDLNTISSTPGAFPITTVSTILSFSDTGLVRFAGTTSSFPALKRSSTTLQVRLADDSADAPLTAANFQNTNATNGQAITDLQTLTELTTIAAAASTDTTIQMPANSVVLGVAVRVTTVIPTATTFTVGDSGLATRFSTASVSTAANSTDPGTKAGAYYNASALSIRLTMVGGTPAANTGRVRVVIYYYTVTPPSS